MSDTPLQPTLVLIHGLFSSPMEFALLSRTLRARGVAFDCLEIPGYTHPSQRPASTWREWIAAAEIALDARYGRGAPIVLGGLCVGGMVAAELARRPRPQRVAGLVLMSPTFAYDGWGIGRWQRWRRIAYLSRIDRWMRVREKAPFGIKNPKTRQWVVQQFAEQSASAVGPASLPLRAIHQTERLYAFVAARIASIDLPMLVLHARDDEIASVASVERVLARAATPPRLVVLDDSYHMITVDNDRQRVAHEMADFVVGSAAPATVPPARALRPLRSDVSRSVGIDPAFPDLWMPT